MKKRMLSAILAMSMVMGMSSVTAFAADPNGTGVEVANDGYKAPTINVTVPTITSAGITLDPYNIAGKGQIYSPEYKVVNNSNVPVVFTLKGTVADSDTVNIVPKALKDGTKWASVSVSITDGLEKTTTKVVPMNDDEDEDTEGIDIAAATYMAAYGGTASFKYTGVCADNVTVDSDEDGSPDVWSNAESSKDEITVSATYSFAPVQCTTISVAKALKVNTTAITVENGTTADKIVFPVVLGDGKEIPVTWTCSSYNASAAGNYEFTAAITEAAKNSGLYDVATTLTWPKVTVTVKAAASAG